MEKGRSYLKIVEDIQNYEEIVDTKIFFEKLFDRIMESNCSKTSDVEKIFKDKYILKVRLKNCLIMKKFN